ncbi:MAG: hypothetical protein HIU93_13010 [Acidobacteria bacterium]|nr:hypothetical protein [Acidobacteriota bacterium]MBW4045462.1 hypothetical protein [Acidobacteriota bacterium]
MAAKELSTERATTRLLGIPLGNFGLAESLLMAFTTGFIGFFLSCFLAIVGILIYNSAGHHAINFADSYKYIALPTGLVVLGLSLLLFVGLWLKRKLSGN